MPGNRSGELARASGGPPAARAISYVPALVFAAGQTTAKRFLEDVQNSVETRGSPELVVYAAWAWAGGGGDSLPSWSSNFGKCR